VDQQIIRSGGTLVQVRIGVQFVAKEIVVETAMSADDVEHALGEALASGTGVLALHDERGGRVAVPAAHVGYVEMAEEENRKVGFGTI
jgi:hypothetical protein